MVLNSRSTTPPEPQEAYVWTFPGCPIRIEIKLRAVEGIGREVLQDTECETGGLLLGQADLRESGTITIVGHEPLRPDRCDRGQFELSPGEIANLEARLSSGTPVRVVGYYRSHLGPHLCLTDNDQLLINRCFTDPSNVFLVVKPGGSGTAAAGFFFWGQGTVFGAFSFLEFPFDARALASEQQAGKPQHDLYGTLTPQVSASEKVAPKVDAGSPLSTVASDLFASTSAGLPELEEACVWTFPGCPIRVELNPQVVERLRREVLQESGSETGGLLLGKTDPERSGTVAIIEYEPLRLAHRDGNQFVLSAGEIANLETRLSSNASAGELRVVGYYRSHLGGHLCLTENDLHLINSCFSDPSHVFLIIKPISSSTANAGFFFWDQGAVFGAFSFLEFPFHALALASGQHGRKAPPDLSDNSPEEEIILEGAVTKAPLNDSPLSTVASEVPGRDRRLTLNRRRWTLLFAVLLAALALTVLLRVSTRSRNPSLGLRIDRDGNDFRVSWNHAAAFVSKARIGRLFIKDGTQQEQYVALDAPMLRSGTVVYSPNSASQSVKFRFEVSGRDGSTATESAIAMVGSRGHEANDLLVQQGEEPEVAAAKKLTTTEKGLLSAVGVPAPALPSQVRVPPLRKQSAGGSRPTLFVAPAPAVRIEYPDGRAIPIPPSIALTWERSTLPTVLQTEAGPESRQSPRVEASATKLEYVAPVLLTRVAPVLPTTLQRLSLDGVRIRLHVQIDEAGRVVGGRSLSAGNSLMDYLSTIALESAKQWRFSPGRLGDKNIPSETVVEFEFAKRQTP